MGLREGFAMDVSTVVQDFVRQHFGPGVRLKAAPLWGGLVARDVVRVDVYRAQQPLGSFVAKPFTAETSREIRIYRMLKSGHHRHLLPALLGWRSIGRSRGYAFLEWVPGEHPWPWSSVRCSSLVLEELASLHSWRLPKRGEAALAGLDYELELRESARSTVAEYRRAFATGVRPGNRPMLRALERFAGDLPRLRRELLAFTGVTLVHGDVHTGNVVLTGKGTSYRPVFFAWAKARMGSPLEDVASWVHSLAIWEPEARRRHDTMLQRYLAARGCAGTLSRGFREACILAGACNALAGALRYHLTVLQDSRAPAEAKVDSYRAAADWLRIVRRADACRAV
jgi:Ser/Thr protein kinase RdoA (MazF antagonist)